MKNILMLTCSVFLLSSCQKVSQLLNDVPLPPGIDSTKYQSSDTNCAVIAQSSPYVDMEPATQAFGFRKVINANTGVVDSLITAIGNDFDVDSGFFAFEYLAGNEVHLTGVVKTYNRSNTPHEWEMDVASMVDIQFQLNSHNYVVSQSYSSDSFTYENGVLKTIRRPSDPAPYDLISFSYDDHGNIKKVMRGNEENNYAITFEYDYSKTARSQMYSPITLYPFYVYEMMGWLPLPIKNLRTRHTITSKTTTDGTATETVQRDIQFSHHVINSFGALESFDAHFNDITLDATIVNTLDCSIDKQYHLPLPQ